MLTCGECCYRLGDNTMRHLQPVVWSKGTLLTPQHLQRQDKFVEDALAFRLQSLKFCPSGFVSLAIDREALGEGRLVLTRARGIFSDGLLFDIPSCDEVPPARELNELFGKGGAQSLDFFLVVPEYRPEGINVALKANGSARFIAQISEFCDENTGEGDKPLQLARKNFRVLGENENREGYSALRIANVERTAAGKYQLNARFVPPLVAIGGSEYLRELLRGWSKS